MYRKIITHSAVNDRFISQHFPFGRVHTDINLGGVRHDTQIVVGGFSPHFLLSGLRLLDPCGKDTALFISLVADCAAGNNVHIRQKIVFRGINTPALLIDTAILCSIVHYTFRRLGIIVVGNI